MSINPYTNRLKNDSVIAPSLKKWIVIPLLERVPTQLPLYTFTFAASVLVWLLFFMVDIFQSTRPSGFWVNAFVYFLYLIGSYMDSMRAKQSTRIDTLGTFFFYFVHAINIGIILKTLLLTFIIDNPYFIALLLVSFYLAVTAIFYRQFKTGWLVLHRFSSSEAMSLVVLVLLTANFEPVYNFYTHHIINGLTSIECILLLFCIWALVIFIKTLSEIASITYAFWLFCFLLVLTSYLCVQLFSTSMIYWVITLYSIIYIGRLIQGHLVDQLERSPGFFTPITLIAVIFASSIANINYGGAIVAYLVINIVLVVYKVFTPFKP